MLEREKTQQLDERSRRHLLPGSRCSSRDNPPMRSNDPCQAAGKPAGIDRLGCSDWRPPPFLEAVQHTYHKSCHYIPLLTITQITRTDQRPRFDRQKVTGARKTSFSGQNAGPLVTYGPVIQKSIHLFVTSLGITLSCGHSGEN